jgi:hypothetical protein
MGSYARLQLMDVAECCIDSLLQGTPVASACSRWQEIDHAVRAATESPLARPRRTIPSATLCEVQRPISVQRRACLRKQTASL